MIHATEAKGVLHNGGPEMLDKFWLKFASKV